MNLSFWETCSSSGGSFEIKLSRRLCRPPSHLHLRRKLFKVQIQNLNIWSNWHFWRRKKSLLPSFNRKLDGIDSMIQKKYPKNDMIVGFYDYHHPSKCRKRMFTQVYNVYNFIWKWWCFLLMLGRLILDRASEVPQAKKFKQFPLFQKQKESD